MIPSLVPKNLFKDAKKMSLSFLQESISYTLVIVETLRNFVVIALWFVCVFKLTLGCEESNLQSWRTNLSEGYEVYKTFLL